MVTAESMNIKAAFAGEKEREESERGGRRCDEDGTWSAHGPRDNLSPLARNNHMIVLKIITRREKLSSSAVA